MVFGQSHDWPPGEKSAEQSAKPQIRLVVARWFHVKRRVVRCAIPFRRRLGGESAARGFTHVATVDARKSTTGRMGGPPSCGGEVCLAVARSRRPRTWCWRATLRHTQAGPAHRASMVYR